jgi:hypothetical protein
MQNIKIQGVGVWLNQRAINIITKLPDAEVPYNDHHTEPTHNITIVQRCDNRTEDLITDINTFTTGLVITPPLNHHVEIIPHPQLIKSGYMLMGPIVIPPNTEDELVLTLFKYKDAPDLELPFVAGQMLVRLTEYSTLQIEGAKSDKKEDIKPEKAASTRGGKAGRGKGNHMF